MNGSIFPTRLYVLASLALTVLTAVPARAGAPVDSALRKVPGSPIEVGDGVTDLEARFDFNLDGIPDLVTSDRVSEGFAVKVHFGEGRGIFSTETAGLEFEPDEPTSVAAGLLVGIGDGGAPTDTRPDIAAAVGGTIRILENVDAGGNADFAEIETLSIADVILREVEVADLNNDGLADVVATGSGDDGMGNPVGKVVVFLNSATGFDAGTVLASPGTHAGRLVIGDLDEDAKLDVIVVNRSQSRVAVYLATAPGTFGNGPVLHSLGSNLIPSGIAFGDISGDASPEILVWRTEPTAQPPNSRFIGITELRHEGSGVLAFDSAIGFEPHPNTIQYEGDVWVADLDFDGQNDFVFTNPVTNQLMIYAVALAPNRELNYHKSKLLFENLSSRPKRISIANLNGDSIRAGLGIVPRVDVVTANEPLSPLRSVDVFLHGVDGGALPVPTLTYRKRPFGSWVFEVSTKTDVPSGAIVKLQYSATPDDPDSWLDVMNGTMSAVNINGRRKFSIDAHNLPLGEVAFRAVVIDTSTAAGGIGKATKLLKIARGLDAYVTEFKSVSPLKFGPSKGHGLVFDGVNASKVTKRVDGDQGQFVWYGMSVANLGDVADVARVQSAGSTGGFLVSYFDIAGMDVTASVVAGTLTLPLQRGQGSLLLLRVRVGATVPVDTVTPFAMNVVSTADANIKDIACVEIEVTQPKDVVFVTNTADTGAGSLRAAMVKVLERFKKKTTVRFELPVTGPGLATIPVPSNLPPIVGATNTVIDGNSQAEYREAVRGTPESGPAVELRGNGGGIGLALETSGCLVRGIQFSNFGTGLQITGLSSLGVKVKALGNVVVGCVFEGNVNTGVHLTDGATANQIGDNETGKANSFSSVDPVGGPVVGSHAITISGEETERNRIHGNVIGSLPTGTATGADVSRGFDLAAITINSRASGNQIGGRHAGEGNHIMGNFGEGGVGQFARGIEILGTGTNSNFIQGNIFGRTPAGVPRTNKGDNIVIDFGASDNLIGGTDPGTGNLIMASEESGVAILSTNDTVATKNRIEGNQIGGYTVFEENRLAGVFVGPKAVQTAIGGEKKGAGNVVLGNGKTDPLGAGLLLLTSTSTDFFTTVRGNFIGVDAVNTVAGNQHGIVVRGGKATNIGGSKDLARNVISGNVGAGVILDGTFNCSIFGNRIGVGSDGVVARGNGGAGVEVINSANQNYIGNIAPGFGNIIKNNGDNGVRIASDSQNIAVRGNDHGNNAVHMPIDLVGGTEDGIGFTQNDPLDPDTGANGLQNSPRITAVQVVGGKTKITLTFNSTPRTGSGGVIIGNLVIPLFAFDVYADGAFLETETVQTDREGEPVEQRASTAEVNGDGSYLITVPKNLTGKVISVTANVRINQVFRLLDGATSEFSNIEIP